jgi:uncharacterized membrane protein YfcA
VWDDFILFVAVGFAAQMVDGAVGMAYGVSATTVMLSFGIPPATASASVHAAEVFTTGISGLSHWRFGNVQWPVVLRLAIPGMIGGAIGAYVLTTLSVDLIKPLITAYLLVIGVWIIVRAIWSELAPSAWPSWLVPLGFGGGFLDAIGGGGWGPLVASPLLSRGTAARYTIGSVNAAEFFVTLVVSVTFLTTIGLELWPIIAGLILGGAVAAPLAAYIAKSVPDRPLMVMVGAVVILLSLRGLIQALG